MKKLPSRLVKPLRQPVGEAASPLTSFLLQPISSNQSVTTKRLRKKQETKTPGTKETEIPLEEEKTKTTKEVPPPKVTAHAEAVDAWLEANMPASPMPSFAEAMLKHYYKFWFKPHSCRTGGTLERPFPKRRRSRYTTDLAQWQKFRVDLRDKMLVGGLPPAAPDGTVCMPRFFVNSLDPCWRENDGGLWLDKQFSAVRKGRDLSTDATCALLLKWWGCNHDDQGHNSKTRSADWMG